MSAWEIPPEVIKTLADYITFYQRDRIEQDLAAQQRSWRDWEEWDNTIQSLVNAYYNLRGAEGLTDLLGPPMISAVEQEIATLGEQVFTMLWTVRNQPEIWNHPVLGAAMNLLAKHPADEIRNLVTQQMGQPISVPTLPTNGAALGNGSKSLSESDSPTLADLMRRMEEMHHDLGSKLDDLKHGMAIIYRHISAKDQTTITMILEDVRQGRIEQGEIQNGLDAIRKVLQHIHTTTLPIADTAVKKSLDDIYQAVNSNLNFHQQLELSLPVIPFLLEYKIGLDAGVDLGAVWKELGERLGKGSG